MALISRTFFSRLDYPLLAAVMGLALFGLLGVYSATAGTGTGYFHNHLIRIGVGMLLCLILANIDYHRLVDNAFLFFPLAVAVLVATLIFGNEIKGSTSWIVIAGISLQPSEFAKPVLILALTRYLSEFRRTVLSWGQILSLGLIFALPVLLVVLQGDMGTALMYFPILGGILLVAGVRMRLLLILLLVLALTAPLGWYFLQDYQRDRILVTFYPDLDPQGVGYQARQSKIAIGSGGLTGKGIGAGFQSQLGFVPENHTDFIFSLLAEETGFVGAASILFLFMFVLFRFLQIAETARDRAGLLLLTGISSLIFAHVLTNVGMTLGVLPAIGVPLPFVSYGGSSTLTMFAVLGLALSVRSRRFVY